MITRVLLNFMVSYLLLICYILSFFCYPILARILNINIHYMLRYEFIPLRLILKPFLSWENIFIFWKSVMTLRADKRKVAFSRLFGGNKDIKKLFSYLPFHTTTNHHDHPIGLSSKFYISQAKGKLYIHHNISRGKFKNIKEDIVMQINT